MCMLIKLNTKLRITYSYRYLITYLLTAKNLPFLLVFSSLVVLEVFGIQVWQIKTV